MPKVEYSIKAKAAIEVVAIVAFALIRKELLDPFFWRFLQSWQLSHLASKLPVRNFCRRKSRVKWNAGATSLAILDSIC